MSEQLTNRQKIIRVAAGAAICGLSISFVLGELVDEKAKLLLATASDPKILPREYSPLRAARVAEFIFDSSAWRDGLLAANSIPLSLPEVTEDKLAMVRSAPQSFPVKGMIRPPYNMAAELKKPQKVLPSLPAEQVLLEPRQVAPKKKIAKALQPTSQDVERVLLSIHDATANLAQEEAKTEKPPVAQTAPAQETKLTDGSVVINGGPISVKKPAPQLVKTEVKTPAAPASMDQIIRAPEPSRERESFIESSNNKKDERTWEIAGKVSGNSDEPGHFEVGLFSQIDPMGIPMGFPFVQQILPAGKNDFSIKIPGKVEKGYLYAEYVFTKSGRRVWIAPPLNPIQKNKSLRVLAELQFKQQDSVSSISASTLLAPARDTKLHGQVNTMFAPAGKPIPQGDVVVKIRGRKEATRTDASGSFAIDLSSVRGVVQLEFLKAGYHPTIVAVEAGSDAKIAPVELASREAIDTIAHRLGIRQSSSKGVFLGRATGTDGVGQRGISIQTSLKNDGPYYFNESGVPTGEKKATTADGRFIFFNVEPSVGFVEASLNGEAIAPFTISLVEGGEMLFKSLTPTTARFRGRLFNPVNAGGALQPVGGARIRIDGSSEWVSTDSYGAFSMGPMKFFRGESVSLEMSADRFYNHRYIIKWDAISRAENSSLFAFPAAYLNKLANSMDLPLDPYSGLIIGKVSGQSVRMDALADQSVVNTAKDFYFDQTGKIRGAHNMTDPRFGTFVIFNVPKGKNILQGNDSNGKLKFSDAVIASPSSVSVMMEN